MVPSLDSTFRPTKKESTFFVPITRRIANWTIIRIPKDDGSMEAFINNESVWGMA